MTATSAVAAAAVWVGVHHRSAAVRGWSPPSRRPIGTGPLTLSLGGQGSGTSSTAIVVLLHGIVGSGRSFGARYDDLDGPVLVPDLLGFGRSMDVEAAAYDVDAHVAALIDTIDGAGYGDRPLVLVGHSMGSVLALHTAAAVPERTRAVIALSGPLYRDAEEGLAHIGGADPLASLVATGDLAERICEWMCEHRQLALRLWPIFAPRLPWPVAADGVLHTWPSYRGSLEALVLDSSFDDALDTLSRESIPVTLMNGEDDGVPVAGRAQDLAGTYANVSAVAVAGADHALPMSHPAVVIEHIATHLA